MTKFRKRLSDEQAKALGLTVKPKDSDGRYARYTLKGDAAAKYLEAETVIKHEEKAKDDSKPFVLSAWNSKGHMMDIDEYCEHYSLPRADIKSYKLVSHTGTPYYNILFKENVEATAGLTEDDFAAIVSKHIKPVEVYQGDMAKLMVDTDTFDRVIYTDVHIGMEPNQNGHALYGGKWNEKTIMKTAKRMVDEILASQESNKLYMDELGDFMDGWDGYTTRGGHKLPQNMDNQKAFDVGIQFKMLLADMLVPHYEYITFNNVCNDNHAGSFGYVVNSAFKQIVELKYKGLVEVNNLRKFIDHYYVGNHAFVITHGKDDKALKFGFKPNLDEKQIEKIDQYLKVNNIYKNAQFIEFSKGDSHQCVFNMAGSDDFDYMNYPALSPSSEWVQTNFKKGRRGFAIQNINYLTNDKNTRLVWLN